MLNKLVTAAALCLSLAVCSNGQPQVEALHRDLGFTCDKSRVMAAGTPLEMPAVTITDHGGAMARAGVRSGNLLAGLERCEDLYAELHRARGRSYSLTLVAGGDGLGIGERAHLVVRLTVPDSPK